nr:reverse transcriptase domain-containing protein [Tanacetum cinerariifolium]
MSTNEKTAVSLPTSAVRNMLGKEHVLQDLGRLAFDAALREYCDRNCHQLLAIIAKKVHQEKEHRAEGGASRKGSDLDMFGSPEPRLENGVFHSESSRKKDLERRTVFKRLENVTAETLKVATRVLIQGKQSLLLKNIITKEYPQEGRNRCQKVKTVREDVGSQNPSGRSQALRTICPNHRKADAFNQRIKAKQWKRPGKGSKKGGNLKKGNTTGNTDGTTMAKGSQTKDYPNFLSQVSRTVTLQSSMIIPLECTMVSRLGMPLPEINQVTEEKIQVAIHPEYPEQTIAIRSTLTKEGRKELCGLLRRNLDIFAWKPVDMTGVHVT